MIEPSNEPLWLTWAREMQSLAQIGLTFCENPYDRARYEQLRGLAARVMAEHTDAGRQRLESVFQAETGYATPKVDVRGAVFQDGRLLLVREASDGHRWTLPGGWADVNESPTDSVIKEVREESGYEVRVRKLAAVWDRARHAHRPPHPFHIWKLFFLCDFVGGSPQSSLETSGGAFFAEDELPEDLSVSRVLTFQLRRMFAHMRDPDLPTEFD